MLFMNITEFIIVLYIEGIDLDKKTRAESPKNFLRELFIL